MPWNNVIGMWGVLPEWMAIFQPQLEAFMAEQSPVEHQAFRFGPEDLIERHGDNLAIIPLHGPMMKHGGLFAMLFGFTSTDMVRRALDIAGRDKDIQGIMVHGESPGGHTAGVHELSETVRVVAKAKPVAFHFDDIGASAAYWAGAHATTITANPLAEIGSLGTMAIVPDTSALHAQAGVKIHVITRAKFKGIGIPGTEVDDEGLAEIGRRVDAVNAFFMRAVKSGRGFTDDQLNAVNDGRVFIASEAKKLGLVDDVRSFEAALAEFGRTIGSNRGQGTRQRLRAHLSEVTMQPRGGHTDA